MLRLTPYGACVALAALAALLLLAALRRGENRAARVPARTLALCCMPAALVCARLLYCLFRLDFFLLELGPLSILETWRGGFLFYGAAAGACLAAALAAKRAGVSVPSTLDELAAPGLLAVAICRLGERFTSEGLGAWVENPALCRLPFAVPNAYGEWQLAVFLWEAAAALVILAVSLRVRGRPGDRFLTALALYACCQVPLESLRMDSCLRIGFVRVSQALSGAALLGVALACGALRAEPSRSRRLRHTAASALAVVAGVALAGGIEWALDKTAVPNLLLYALMAADSAFMAFAALRGLPGFPAKAKAPSDSRLSRGRT